MRKITLITLLIAVLLASAWYFFLPSGTLLPFAQLGTAKQNVVFILIDTLRADRLPTYGYKKNTAPFLDSLAKQGVVFDSAVAPSSWTAPSMASIFTSQYPSEHGVITGFMVRERLKRKEENLTFNKIASSQFTLPEYFKTAGYQTIGVADNMNISAALGFEQGFDSIETLRYKSAPVVNEKARAKLGSIDRSKPLFLYLHYMDPHFPFNARKPWYEHSKDRKQDIKNRYDSEISFVDDHIRQLFEEFPYLRDSLVVVMSDHGEQFWEHGQRGHGKTLHRPEIHVPLFFYHPNIKQQSRVKEVVSMIDVLPTLAELTGGVPDVGWRGKSLASLINGGKAQKGALSELLLHEARSAEAEYRSLVKGSRHLIKKLGAQPVLSAYQWLKDMDEQNGEVISDDSVEARLFESYENSLMSSEHETGEVEFDQDAIEQLKTLGYVQ